MSSVLDGARRVYRFLKRWADPSYHPYEVPDPREVFPVDAWTDERYQEWLEAHRATADELARQRELAPALATRPLFSLIVPLYQTPVLYLRQMADSVLAQTYPYLELVLVNASPESGELAQELGRYQEADDRVKVVPLAGNLGITENTNRGLGAAAGDFCCFLDHDDFLEPDTLFEYARVVNDDPATDFLYCDEDMFTWDAETESFAFEHPLFKPGFSPELLLCKNYIIHLMCVRRTLIDEMPRPDRRFDGSQDHNMALFCTQRARSIHNVQRVLYHWRMSTRSTATHPDSKPYSIQSGRLSIEAQLRRSAIRASIVETDIWYLYNLWFGPSEASVSVVVDCRGEEATVRFLQFFRQGERHEGTRLVLVNPAGAWEDELAEGVTAAPVSCESENLYRRLNEGAAHATGELLLFMDANSAFVSPEAMAQLAGMCGVDGVGCAGPKVLYRGGLNKSFGAAVTPGGIFPLYRGYEDSFPGYQCNIRCLQDAGALGWEGLMTPRGLFEELGGFDERFTSQVGAAEYCVRVREAGQRAVTLPTAKLRVYEPAPELPFEARAGAPDYPEADVAAFDAKWPGYREHQGDRYSPSLDQTTGYQQLENSSAQLAG